jgi:hypothetical protein
LLYVNPRETNAGPDIDPRLTDLRAKWGRHWRIWRARTDRDIGDERTGDFMASRLDPAAGPDPTVMEPTAERLNDALQRQADKAASGVWPLTVSEAGPE